ncbi:MAG: DUF6194 family protein [Gemmobacter sp.]
MDQLPPHPVYGWMGRVAMPNPSLATFDRIGPLIDAGFVRVRARFRQRPTTPAPRAPKGRRAR